MFVVVVAEVVRAATRGCSVLPSNGVKLCSWHFDFIGFVPSVRQESRAYL